MSSASFALPEFPPRAALSGGSAWRPAGKKTTRSAARNRAARFASLLVVLLRLFLVARFRFEHLSAGERDRSIYHWARRLLSALCVEVRARGHIPAPGALLLVANHVSWLDAYALNTVSSARFVAKSEVRGWPIVGVIAARFGTHFLERGRLRAAARAVLALADVLRSRQPVAVFPEGTTSEGDTVLHFYPAMFQAAVLSGARVQPVAIRYRTVDGRPTRAAAYVGDMSILDSVRRLLREPRIIVELAFCAPLDPHGRTRKQLAAAARAAIVAALEGEDALRRAA
jgi:1-acyl-sn-glycerol-3-phosphate acyltransferase